MVIDFTSRERLDMPANRTAKFEILSWGDPIMRGTPYDPTRVMIDGRVPVDLAHKIKALSDDCPEAELDILGLNNPDLADIIAETGRVLVEGLVPFALAQQAQAICNAHNASLPPIDA